jgi:hypothetical protein
VLVGGDRGQQLVYTSGPMIAGDSVTIQRVGSTDYCTILYLDAVCMDSVVTSVAGGELFGAFRALNLLETDGAVGGPPLYCSIVVLRLLLHLLLLRFGAVDDGFVRIDNRTVCIKSRQISSKLTNLYASRQVDSSVRVYVSVSHSMGSRRGDELL